MFTSRLERSISTTPAAEAGDPTLSADMMYKTVPHQLTVSHLAAGQGGILITGKLHVKTGYTVYWI